MSTNSLYTISTTDIVKQTTPRTKVYKRRYWMLSLYVLLALFSAMLFPQYVSMANVTGCYYNVSQYSVNWTTQMFFVVYVVLLVPVSFLMEYIELRWSVICGSVLNTIACAFQFLTLKPNGFVFVLVSNFFGAIASIFVLGLSPYLAAKWFPSHELSRACAFGVFGSEVGVSIGLIFSPLMVSSNCTETDLIEEGKIKVAYILVATNALLLILIFITFQNAPDLPPNLAELEKGEKQVNQSTVKTLIYMIKNLDYMLVFLLGGLMAGIFYTITTIANNLMIKFFPQQEVNIAWMTTLFSLMGIVGSIIAGYILDYTHKFKEVAMTSCIASLLLFIVFSCVLYLKILWVQFVVESALGFFVGGFFPIGLEYGTETTFPMSELLSANSQFWSMQMFGVILIQIVSNLLDNYEPLYSLIAIGLFLLLCSVISSFLTRNYKRSRINYAN